MVEYCTYIWKGWMIVFPWEDTLNVQRDLNEYNKKRVNLKKNYI